MSNFDLKDLQDSVIGVPNDLILPEDHVNELRDERRKTTQRIVDIYTSGRKNNRVFKSTYNALTDHNPFIRVAAADIIGEAGNSNSFDYLFKALEDEDKLHVKQRIVSAIDRLEAKLNSEIPIDSEISFVKAMKLVSYQS